jgi:hypothetical protein
LKTGWVAAALLAFTAVGCADLEVTNLNDPDARRAISNAGDVESLIAGAFNTWHYQKYTYTSFGPFLSNQSFQHTAPWANFGMEYYGRIPRQPVGNFQAHPEYGNIARSWNQTYSALSAVADGLRALNNDQALVDDLGADRYQRIQAYGKFVQGVGHGALGLAYARGFIVDETTDLSEAQEPVDYMTMVQAALGYLDDAIALADAGFTADIPSQWMSVPVSSDLLADLAHSYKARFMANVARTPAERDAVDWQAVINEVDAGVQTDWVMNMDFNIGWWASGLYYSHNTGWSEMNMFINGMADQSGNYQRWLDMPLAERVPAPAGEDHILIITDDLRFPQGPDVATQMANPGTGYVLPCVDDGTDGPNPPECSLTDFAIGNVWARPDRGTWRWSYYWFVETIPYTESTNFDWPEVAYDEMHYLKAEGLYRLGGNEAQVATMINATRVPAGLNATDAAGTNTSCVPKLPDGSCGDLLEMLKWEKRQTARAQGAFMAPWYFDGRGWGDLYAGTPLHYPIPCGDVQVLQLEGGCVTFGGDPTGGNFSSPGSIYGFDQ